MSGDMILITYIAVTAILLAICGYNDLTGTPAPLFAVGWPLVLIGFAAYGVFMIPVLAGRTLRKIIPATTKTGGEHETKGSGDE